jgi:tRNA A37 threonylcarbamoyladenosine biosynthesis protein TsaE
LRAGIIDERQQHGVTLIEWPEHLEGLGAEEAGVLGIHLATTADEGTRSATIRGARAELLAALDTALGTSGSARG